MEGQTYRYLYCANTFFSSTCALFALDEQGIINLTKWTSFRAPILNRDYYYRVVEVLKKVILGVVLIASGVALLYLVTMYGFSGITEKNDIRSQWPYTSGRVLYSDVSLEPLSDDNEIMTVEFTYQVDGVNYTSKQTWCVGEELFGSRSKEAREALDKYPEGKNIIIFYNPENPKEAAVETRVVDFSWQFYPLGLAFIGGMILTVVGMIKIVQALYQLIFILRSRIKFR